MVNLVDGCASALETEKVESEFNCSIFGVSGAENAQRRNKEEGPHEGLADLVGNYRAKDLKLHCEAAL